MIYLWNGVEYETRLELIQAICEAQSEVDLEEVDLDQ